MRPLLLLSSALLLFPSCSTLKLTDTQQLIADTVADAGVAFVVAQHPEFTPYADAVGELVRTQGITPAKLSLALDAYLVDSVSPEDQAGVGAVLDVLKRSYARYYDAKQVEVFVSNEDMQDSLAESLQPPLPSGAPSNPSPSK